MSSVDLFLGPRDQGGLFLGSGKVTFRGDVRYFKSFETSGDFPQITGDKLGFWRATAGIGLMW